MPQPAPRMVCTYKNSPKKMPATENGTAGNAEEFDKIVRCLHDFFDHAKKYLRECTAKICACLNENVNDDLLVDSFTNVTQVLSNINSNLALNNIQAARCLLSENGPGIPEGGVRPTTVVEILPEFDFSDSLMVPTLPANVKKLLDILVKIHVLVSTLDQSLEERRMLDPTGQFQLMNELSQAQLFASSLLTRSSWTKQDGFTMCKGDLGEMVEMNPPIPVVVKEEPVSDISGALVEASSNKKIRYERDAMQVVADTAAGFQIPGVASMNMSAKMFSVTPSTAAEIYALLDPTGANTANGESPATTFIAVKIGGDASKRKAAEALIVAEPC